MASDWCPELQLVNLPQDALKDKTVVAIFLLEAKTYFNEEGNLYTLHLKLQKTVEIAL